MLSSRRGSPRPILASCSTAHAAHDGLAEALLALLPLWAQAFGLSLTQVGILKSVFYGAMTAGQIPSGFVAERLGERRLLALGTLVAAVGWLLLAEAHGFQALLAALVVAGIGSSVQHPLASSLVSRAFRGGQVRSALGVYNFAGDAGKAVVPALVALGIGLVGWRTSSTSCGIAMAAVALGLHLALMRSEPKAAPATPGPDADADVDVDVNGDGDGDGDALPAWGVVDIRGFVRLCAIACIDAAARSGFLLLVPFLMVGKGLAVEHVGFALMLVFAGGAAGKFACGFIAQRLGTVRTIVITEAATALGILTAVALPMEALWALLVPLGAALNGTSSALYAAAGEFAHEKRQARTFGLFYSVTTAAYVVAPFAFGVIADVADPAFGMTLVAVLALGAAPIALAMRSVMRDEPGTPT